MEAKLDTTSRALAAKELRLLNLILESKKKELEPKNTLRFFAVLLLVTIVSAGIAWQLPDGVWLFIFGTIAVTSFVGFVFSVKPTIQEITNERTFIKDIENYTQQGKVGVTRMKVSNIAEVYLENEDSMLFLIEIEKDKILFYWDFKYALFRKFPCEEFEIYDESYQRFTDIQFNFLSKKIEGLNANAQSVSNYIRTNGKPKQFEIRTLYLKDLIDF